MAVSALIALLVHQRVKERPLMPLPSFSVLDSDFRALVIEQPMQWPLCLKPHTERAFAHGVS